MLPYLIMMLYGIICFHTVLYAFPLRVRNIDEATVYLRKFGYIKNYTRGFALSSETFSASLKDFQRFVGLNETGKLDSETLEVMSLPRCGMKDMVRHSETSRKKQYVLEGEPSDTPSNLCKDASFDTITRTKDGKSFVFKGRYYWRILSNGKLTNGYPRKIADDWQGLEGNLDASFTHSNGTTFFFKGKYYWSFNNKKMDNGFPRRISKGFHGIPRSLDAALFWGKNSKIYFFKGTRYWRYDSDSFPHVRDVYPAQIARWDKVLKNGIDAAVLWEDNSSYFFKGDQYYKYDDKYRKVEKSYPVPTASHWFGCGSNTIKESSK